MGVVGGGGRTNRGQRERDHDRGKKRADHSNGAGREVHREGSLHTRSASAKAADIGCAQFFPSPTLRVLRGCSRRDPRSNDFYPLVKTLNAEITEDRRGVRGDLAPKRRRTCKRLMLVAPSSFRARLSVYSAAVRGELRDPMIFTPLVKTLNA